MTHLAWPAEAARYPHSGIRSFSAPDSNIVLDFHGDPLKSNLVVFSDGNHHMALEASIRQFLTENPDVIDIFYTTTPPAPLVQAAKNDGLAIGNLHLSLKPDVFIGPDDIITGLHEDKIVQQHKPFAKSRGNVLLVRKGNPKNICSISDLLSENVRLTCSNPVNEKASFSVYRQAAINLCDQAGIQNNDLLEKLTTAGENTVHSQVIHHREVPQIIADKKADVAIIYYHLALRYTRIFPEIFELVDVNENLAQNNTEAGPITDYHIGIVNTENPWSEKFYEFMLSGSATELYEAHGLSG